MARRDEGVCAGVERSEARVGVSEVRDKSRASTDGGSWWHGWGRAYRPGWKVESRRRCGRRTCTSVVWVSTAVVVPTAPVIVVGAEVAVVVVAIAV